MKHSFTFISLLIIGFCISCRNQNAIHDELETLQLGNQSMKKMVDREIEQVLWTNEQRGRNNTERIKVLEQLANSRKQFRFDDPSTMEGHVSFLESLTEDIGGLPELELVFERVSRYLEGIDDSRNEQWLQVDLSYIELMLVREISNDLAIVDCCFSVPIQVQAKGDATADQSYDMAIFPGSDKALLEHVEYSYDRIYLSQAGKEIPIVIQTNRIGHVITLQFKVADPGEYLVHFSVTQNSAYYVEPWKQDFEWPITVR